MHPDAAAAVEALAREHFEERGRILVRFGRAPKRAILLRTDEPFKKIARKFTAPDGSEQQIEILANGQQVVVFGTAQGHRQTIRWHGGEPGEIKREDLPYVREADMVAFLDAAAELLVKDFGFKAKKDDSKRKSQWRRASAARNSGRPVSANAHMQKPRSRAAPQNSPRPHSGSRNETVEQAGLQARPHGRARLDRSRRGRGRADRGHGRQWLYRRRWHRRRHGDIESPASMPARRIRIRICPIRMRRPLQRGSAAAPEAHAGRGA